MTNTNLRPIPPNSSRHLLPIAQLAADAFSGGEYVEQFCENYIGNNHYDWDVSRIVFDDEKLIHHWGVWGYQMRVESAQLKTAGIGAVVTHEDHRKQGIMHRAAQESFDAMRQNGYDLSILRGKHYVKIGYARAWNYVNYKFTPEEIKGLEIKKPYQPLGVESIHEMNEFYNRTHASFTGTAIRPTYLNKHPDDIGVYAWFDENGQLEGYIRAFPAEDDPKLFQCLEAAGDPQQGLAILTELFQKSGCEKLSCFTLPYFHPMTQVLRKGACIVEDRYFDVSGWRVKIINLQSTLTKLIPLFERRLSHSQFANWAGSLHLDGGEHQATLSISNGKVEITHDASENILHGGADIARFLIGSDEPEEIMRQANMKCERLALPLTCALFPNLHPMLSHWDEF
jgi:predicted N-acetyltransferase YhbS